MTGYVDFGVTREGTVLKIRRRADNSIIHLFGLVGLERDIEHFHSGFPRVICKILRGDVEGRFHDFQGFIVGFGVSLSHHERYIACACPDF